jgi:uncharacterized membrane protein YfcA
MVFRLLHMIYGIGMTIGALVGALFLNIVFERTWQGIAMILLAMLMVILIRRMIIGGIPLEPVPPKKTEHSSRPDLWQETAHLPGVDHRYGWMALPPALAFCTVVVTLLI